MATTSTNKKHSLYKPGSCRTPPRAGGGGGDDSTIDSSLTSQFAAMQAEDDQHYQQFNGDNDNNDDHQHPVIASSASYESRGDSTISSGHSSDNTERANNKAPPPSRDNNGTTANNEIMSLNDDGDDDNSTIPEEDEMEVRKEDGATELFMAIESAAWDDVCDRLEENPDEAKIWVTSSGKDNALFSWEVWRRLPLHEACRRQPPPVVIYALLSAYPASSHIESNFGELPLHAAVRCGACAEVVNSILASYPAAVFARDNSGCTPMDILNGTGRIMDHDVVIAALNRTTRFLTKEENVVSWKMEQVQFQHKADQTEQRSKYESMIDKKNTEIDELKRQLQQEKKATSNLASKVIQTETVVQQKMQSENRNMGILERMEGELLDLNASNSSRKTKIAELEEIIESDRKTIMELTEVIETLRSQLTSICEEEEQFVAKNLAKAEANLKTMFETQYVFLKETEKRKELMRERLSTLGISLSASMSEEDEEEEEEESEEEEQSEVPGPPSEDEPSDDEVARVALASAMQAVEPLMQQEEDVIDDVLSFD